MVGTKGLPRISLFRHVETVDAIDEIGTALVELQRAVVGEIALASLLVDEGHAVAVDREIRHEQQHFLPVAEGVLDERERAVERMRGDLDLLVKGGYQVGECRLDR